MTDKSGRCRVCGVKLKHVRYHERTAHGIYLRAPNPGASTAVTRRAHERAAGAQPKHSEEQRAYWRDQAAKQRAKNAKSANGARRARPEVVAAELVTAPVPSPVPARANGSRGPGVFKQMPFVVLEDHEGGVWLAERIR